MSAQIQDSAHGKNPKDLHPDLPSGVLEGKEVYIKSKPIPPSERVFVSGRLDVLSKFDDGTHGVIDLKITDPRSDTLHKFSRQLHAYKYALENPMDSNKLVDKISKLGLLILSPESVEMKKGKVVYSAQPTWHEIDEDTKGFLDFIEEVTQVLEGEPPNPSTTCRWCTYREHPHFEKPKAVQEDIPF